LSTLFQIDFKVIRIMRRESFSFSFVKNIDKYSEGTLDRLGVLASFTELA